jgi:hypothetical protein
MAMLMTMSASANKQKQKNDQTTSKDRTSCAVKKKRENHFAEKVSFLGSIVSSAVLSESIRNTQVQR